MDNIIKVIFEEWQETQFDNTLKQWSYGHTLQVEGVTLPDGNIEVHFSLTDYDGEAPVYIGYVKNNVLTVEIPDFILQKENVYAATYEAYAWIYFTDGDFGKTMRKIVFTIEARAKPTTDIPEDKKEPFLDEVRKIMNETKEVAQSVRDDADNGKFNGHKGPAGENGKDGKSAYDYAVEGGFEGTEQEFIDLMAQAGQVDLTGYVTKEEHEAELLKAMVKVTTEEAPFHHITDSANMKVLDFGMSGITEQDTVPGNQLFDISKFKSNTQAINNGDGTITLTAYAPTSFKGLSVYCPNIVVGQTIIVSHSGGAGCLVLFGNTTYECNKPITVTQEMIDKDWFGFYGGSNTTTDNPFIISDIMVNEGTTALPYEPYVGGMSSQTQSTNNQSLLQVCITKRLVGMRLNYGRMRQIILILIRHWMKANMFLQNLQTQLFRSG